jgi:hypothetical protein
VATTQELIDEHLSYQEGLAITDLAARRKVLRNLQRALDYLWNLRDFTFTYSAFAPTIVVTGGRTYLDIAAGDRFLRLGPQALVTVDGRRLSWISQGELETAYQLAPRTGNPQFYTDPQITGAGNPSSIAVFLYPSLESASGHVASLAAKFRSPVLHDDGDDPSGPDDELQYFPEQWHRPLLYEVAVLYEMKDKANHLAVKTQTGIVTENTRNYLATERVGASAIPLMAPFRPNRRRLFR